MNTTRRGLLTGLVAFVAAPAIVRATSIMPVKAWVQDSPPMSKQIDIHRASFRIVDETPGHVRIGVWVNGGKCGDLTVRQEESVGFQELLRRAGFIEYSRADRDNE